LAGSPSRLAPSLFFSSLEKFTRKVRSSKRLKVALLLGPPVAYLMVWFVAPFVLTLMYSFDLVTPNRQFVFSPSLQYYLRVMGWEGVFKIFVRSVGYGLLTSVVCALLAYPAAYYVSFKCRRYKDALLLVFIIPFWVSFLLRTYALMGVLAEEGFLNSVLLWLGVIEKPIKILYTQNAVIIGMVYNYLLFMVLPLYGSIEKLDKSLLEAASTLGANPVSTFIKVTLPLTMPGVAAGFLLVFIPAVGEFIIPSLMGSTETYMMGNVIWDVFLYTRHWWLGSALSVLFIIFVLSMTMIYLKAVGAEELVI